MFTAVTGETAIFMMLQKHLLLAENECAISIIQSAVFVQTSAKIHPHKPVLTDLAPIDLLGYFKSGFGL